MSAEEGQLKRIPTQSQSIYGILFDMKDQMGNMQASLARVEEKTQSLPGMEERLSNLEDQHERETGAAEQQDAQRSKRDRRIKTASTVFGVVGTLFGVASTIYSAFGGKW